MAHVIIDKIRLHDRALEADFVHWVRETDYARCPELPSVLRFQVVRAGPEADCDFFEIVEVTSADDFARDTRTPAFAALVRRFSELARVTETLAGEGVPPGFVRDA